MPNPYYPQPNANTGAIGTGKSFFDRMSGSPELYGGQGAGIGMGLNPATGNVESLYKNQDGSYGYGTPGAETAAWAQLQGGQTQGPQQGSALSDGIDPSQTFNSIVPSYIRPASDYAPGGGVTMEDIAGLPDDFFGVAGAPTVDVGGGGGGAGGGGGGGGPGGGGADGPGGNQGAPQGAFPPDIQSILDELIRINPKFGGNRGTGNVGTDIGQLLTAFPELMDFIDFGAASDEANPWASRGGPVLNALSGPFSGDIFETPGGAALQLMLNTQLAQVNKQGKRAQDAEGILASLVSQGGLSTQNRGNKFLAAAAGDLVAPGALDSLRSSEETRIREGSAQQALAGQQALRDAGLLGGGGSSQDAMVALADAVNRGKLGAERGLTQDMEQYALDRIGGASGALGTSTDIFRALIRDPQQTLAGVLKTPQNIESRAMIDMIGQAAALESGQQIQTAGGSIFEEAIAPLLGGTIGAIGQAGGIGKFFGGGGEEGGK